MAINKQISTTGFDYKLNNHVAFLDASKVSKDFHNVLGFLEQSKVAYALTASPIIYCEITEEMWTSAQLNEEEKVLTLSLKGNQYTVNGEPIRNALNLCNTPTFRNIKTKSKTKIQQIY